MRTRVVTLFSRELNENTLSGVYLIVDDRYRSTVHAVQGTDLSNVKSRKYLWHGSEVFAIVFRFVRSFERRSHHTAYARTAPNWPTFGRLPERAHAYASFLARENTLRYYGLRANRYYTR